MNKEIISNLARRASEMSIRELEEERNNLECALWFMYGPFLGHDC